MASSGILNASLVKILLGASAIAECTNVDVNLSASEVDQSSKSSAGYKARRPGLISGTVSFQGNLRFDVGGSDSGIQVLYETYNNREPLTVYVGTGLTGDKSISGNAYLTSLNIGAGTEDNVTIEGSFKFTGAITQVTT